MRSLTKITIRELNEARCKFRFSNICGWTYKKKIMYRVEDDSKIKIYFE